MKAYTRYIRLLFPAIAFCTMPVHAQDRLDGKEIVDRVCTVCHDTGRIVNAKKTQDEWQETVDRMIDEGAQLTERENAVLVEYLAKTFGKEKTSAKIRLHGPVSITLGK